MALSVPLQLASALLREAEEEASRRGAAPGSREERGLVGRAWAGLELAEAGAVTLAQDHYRVASRSGGRPHQVSWGELERWGCDCGDHVHRKLPCAHIFAVRAAFGDVCPRCFGFGELSRIDAGSDARCPLCRGEGTLSAPRPPGRPPGEAPLQE